MYRIAFDWDREKDSANRQKHSVGFLEASTVFDDSLSITISDSDHDDGEERFVIGDRIRLISARPAKKHVRRKYEQAYQ